MTTISRVILRCSPGTFDVLIALSGQTTARLECFGTSARRQRSKPCWIFIGCQRPRCCCASGCLQSRRASCDDKFCDPIAASHHDPVIRSGRVSRDPVSCCSGSGYRRTVVQRGGCNDDCELAVVPPSDHSARWCSHVGTFTGRNAAVILTLWRRYFLGFFSLSHGVPVAIWTIQTSSFT